MKQKRHKMEENLNILAIAKQLLSDSDESDQDIDSDLEYDYIEEELLLSMTIEERKKTLRELIEESGLGKFSELETEEVARNNDETTFKTQSGTARDTLRGRYSDKVARTMDDTTFKTHFGMTRHTFRVVRDHLHGRVPEKYVDLDTQLMCTLWMLGTQDSYRSTAERFELSKGTVHFIVMRLCKELASTSDRFICWPSADQRASAAARFEEKAGFPGVIGCVDHTCVKLKEPSNVDHNSSAGVHVQVQGVCDVEMKFTSVHMQHQGCEQNVCLNNELVQLTEELGNQYHILGDLKYPLEGSLLTPYQDSDNLLEWHRKYNQIHRETHAQIGYAFAQLKLRFWRLKSLDMSLKDRVREVILACCVLHNIIVDHEGPLEMTYSEMTDLLEEDSHGSAPDHPQQQGNSRAASKRERMARKLR